MKRKLSCLFLVFSLLFASIATNNVFAEPDLANVEPIISYAEVTLSLQDGTALSYNENTQVFDKLTENHSISDINVTVTHGGTALTFDSDYTIVWWKKDSAGYTTQISDLSETFQTSYSYILAIYSKDNETDTKPVPFTLAQEVESISLSSTPLELYIGETKNVGSPILTPSNVFDTSVSWSSDDESIATVDSSGNVTGIAEGSTEIWATSVSNPDEADSITVNVSSSIDELPLKRTSATMLVGDTLDLTTSGDELIMDDNIKRILVTSFNVKWETDNEEVATVDSDGTVTAHKLGKAKITVTGTSFYTDSDTKSATCNIEVIEAGAPIYPIAPAITLDKTEITCTPGDVYPLNITVNPKEEQFTVDVDNSEVIEYEYIEESKISFRAKAVGTATIKVILDNNQSKFATCKVTVKSPTITALDPIYNQDLWKSEELSNEAIKYLPVAIISGQNKNQYITSITIKNDELHFNNEIYGDFFYALDDMPFSNDITSWALDKFGIDNLEKNTILFIPPELASYFPAGTYTCDIKGTDIDGTEFTGTTKITLAKNTYYDDLTWVKGSSDDLTIASMPNLTADALKKVFTIADLNLAKNFVKVETEIDDDIFNVDEDGNLNIKKEMLEVLAKDLEEDTNFNIEFTLKPKQSMFPQGPWGAKALIAKKGYMYPFSQNSGTKIDVNFKIALTAPSTGGGDTGNGDTGNGDNGTGDTGNGSGGGGYYDNVTTNFTDDATCTHEWTDATCTTPKTCSKCGETEGQALGHNYTEEVIAPTNSFLGATFCTCSNTGCNSSYYKDYTLLAGSHPTYLPDGRTISGNVTSTSTTVNRNGTNLNIILEDPLGVITKSGDTFTLEATQLADTSSLDSTHAIEYIHAYEINPVVNGNKISGQLSNKVRMLYEIPSDWDKADLQVVLMQSGSDVEFDEKTEILNGKEYLVIWTDHFSPYGFIDTLSADEKAQGQTGVTFVKTGESNVCLVTALLLSTISAGLFLEICLRKKFKKQ